MVEHFYDNFGDLQKTDRQTDKRWWNLYPPTSSIVVGKKLSFSVMELRQVICDDKADLNLKLYRELLSQPSL